MNKIYSLVWNRSRKQIEVASELARSAGGAATAGVGRPGWNIRAGVLAASVCMALGAALPAMAQVTVQPGDTVTYTNTDGNVVISQVGSGSTFDLQFDLAPSLTVDDIHVATLQVGAAKIDASGIDAGNQKIINVADGTVAAGSKDAVNGGQLNTTNQNVAANTAAIGTNTTAIATNTSNISTNTSDIAANTSAIGTNTSNIATLQGNALQWNGTAYDAKHGGAAQKIVNVKSGTATTDAVNVGQLNSVQTAANGKIDSLGADAAAIFGGGATYNATTGKISSPTYTITTGQGTTSVHSVGDALSLMNGIDPSGGTVSATGIKYFHANSTAADSQANGDDSVAIGPASSVDASSANGIAMGNGAAVNENSANTIAIGSGAHSAPVESPAGSGNFTPVTDAVAIGTQAVVSGTDALAFGHSASAGTTGVGIGANAIAGGISGTAVGNAAQAAGTSSVAVGDGALAATSGTVSIGQGAGAGDSGNVAGTRRDLVNIGHGAGQNVAGRENIAIGLNAGSNVAGDQNVALGTAAGSGITGGGRNNVALGFQANQNAGAIDNAVAIGASSSASTDGVAVGFSAASTGTGVAIGRQAATSGAGGVALGFNTRADGNFVALGQNASATSSDVVGPGYITGTAFSGGAVSVGNANLSTPQYRRIVNVADGAQAHDAVNVEQLRGAQQSVANMVGGGMTVDPNTGAFSSFEAIGSDGLPVEDSNGNPVKFSSVSQALGDLASGNLKISSTGSGNIVTYNGAGQINNVTAGTQATDAVNVQQMNAAVDASRTHYYSVNSSQASQTINYDNSGATGTDASAMGPAAQASGDESLAIGLDTVTKNTAANATAIGSHVTADGVSSTAIGTDGTYAWDDRTVAIGSNASARDENSIVIGTDAQSNRTNSPSGDVKNSVVIGTQAISSAEEGIALGLQATASGTRAMAQGHQALASAQDAQASGSNAQATATNASAQGTGATASAGDAFAIGTGANAGAASSYALGNTAKAGAANSYAMGNSAETGANASDAQAIGTNARANSANDIAFGNGAVAGDDTAPTASSDHIAIGSSANVTGDHAVAIGAGNTVAQANTFVLGRGVTTTQANSVVLGNASTDRAATTENNNTFNGITYTYAGPGAPAQGVVSMGSAGGERQVINVAAGKISASSTDAVNGSQLYATDVALGNVANTAVGILGGNAKLGTDGKLTMTNIAGTGKNTVNDAIVAARTTLTAGTNVAGVNQAQSNGAYTYKIDADGASVSAGSSAVAVTKGTPDANNVTNYAVDLSQATKDTLSNNTTNIAKGFNVSANGGAGHNFQLGDTVDVAQGTNIVVSQDATTGALTIATSETPVFTSVTTGTGANTTVMDGTGITVNGGANGPVSLTGTGLNNGGNKIVNVADGTDPNDAVNVSQLDTAVAGAKTHYYSVNDGGTQGGNYDNDGATGSNALAAGAGALATGDQSVAIGNNAVAQGVAGIAMGAGTTTGATGQNVAIGSDGTAASTADPLAGAVAIGRRQQAEGGGAVAIGYANTATGDGSVAIGRANDATGEGSLAMGDSAIASDFRAVALGSTASAAGSSAVAVGDSATAGGSSAIAIGRVATATAANTISMGDSAAASASGALAFGSRASATNANDVALGAGSSTAAPSTGPYTLNGAAANIAATSDTNGVVSVGSAGNERQIQNVAAGTVSQTSTDAVNGSQLYAVGNAVNNLGGSVASGMGGTSSYDPVTGKVTTGLDVGGNTYNNVNDAINAVDATANAGWNLSANGGTGVNIKPGATVNVAQGTNIVVTQDATTGALTIATSETPVFTSVTTGTGANTTVMDGSGITVNGGANGPVTLTGAGLDNGGNKIINVADGTDPTDAVNLGQLDAATAGVKTHYYSVNDGGTQGGNYDNDGATGVNSLAAGVGATSAGRYATAVGFGAEASGYDAIAVGDKALAAYKAAVAMGAYANAGGTYATAIGTAAYSTGTGATALGAFARAQGDYATAAGLGSYAAGNGSAFGYSASANVGGTAIGDHAKAAGYGSFAGGQAASAAGYAATALGHGASAAGDGAVAIGNASVASGTYGTAVGSFAVAQGYSAAAFGDSASALGDNSLALGANSVANNVGDVALGAGSVTAAANPTASATIGGTTYNFAGANPTSVVSVGSVGNERQITNVAAGRLSGTSTDAVNGSQLYATNQAIDAVGSVANAGWNLSANGGTPVNIKPGATVDVAQGTNIVVTQAADGSLTIATSMTPVFTSVTAGNSKLDNGGLNVNDGTHNTSYGSTGMTIAGGPSVTTQGIDAGNQKITNVAAGTAPTDAVNVGQLDGAVGGLQNQINNINQGGSGMFQTSADSTGSPAPTGKNSAAGGANATASGTDAVAVGNDSKANGNQSTALGTSATASGNGSTALGDGASATGDNSVALGAGSVASGDNTVSVGSAGNERRITNVAAGTAGTDAVNVSQLQAAQKGGVQYDSNPDGTTNYNSVTLNPGGTGPTVIHNVATGVGNNDAVNVGQMNTAIAGAVSTANNYTDQRYNELKGSMSQIGNRANAGIASAIAAASLPQPYAPNQSSLGVGLGSFRGEAGIAVGMSKISESGRFILKANVSSDTRGDVGAGVGAGIVW